MSAQSRSCGLLLIGGGKMGGALLGGWLGRGIVASDQVIVIEPDPGAAEGLRDRHGVTTHAAIEDAGTDLAPETVVFAVKPQVMADVAPSYRGLVGPGRAFLSIAAGLPIRAFEGWLGSTAAIVRAMPNTPAAIGQGITVLCANRQVDEAQRGASTRLLEAVGQVAWIDDEADMDAVTAVSGSGPAYVFLLIECLTAAGIEAGLDPELAARLATATVAGAGALAQESDDDARTLRQNVTSPGGTTAAALEVLMGSDGLQPLMTRAVAAATRRGRELAQG
ncbi:MAG: pyrroline-5-carboxylate reductase [Alphaproteobacteria bacterium]|jgi:pyrroline-5-carboxylate reductase|nr:pyrroline-5-carboxylate reductase [Alphaproteobacteria bacterium]MDP6518024.1 pyrroline-5-carboxylate reductase [Alphaproteobacteria bacterium]